MALSCAVIATLLQQWARRYIKITQPSLCSPEKRARIRALFAGSTDKLLIKVFSAMLPCYLHLSLLLFFIGLLIFLFDINRIVFGSVTYWIGVSLISYGFFTVLSIFQSDGLLYTPLSSLFGSVIASILYFVLTVFGDRFGFRLWKLRGDILERDFERLSGDLLKVDEKIISRLSSEIDVRVLEWTVDALSEDSALEKFFDSIPGFFNSKLDNNLLRDLPHRIRDKFEKALNGFLDRTFSSNTISMSIQSSRLEVCLNAAHAACRSYPVSRLLQVILRGRWHEALRSLNIGQSLRRWSNSNDGEIALHAQSIIALIVVNTEEHDDRWVALVNDEFGVTDDDLQDYIAYGDSVSFSILVEITRRFLRSNFTSWDSSFFKAFSSIDIRNTLPRLQRDFCALWNELIYEAQKGDPRTPILLLKNLRHFYIALHQGTDASPTAFSASTTDHEHILDLPSSYPSCHCLDTPSESQPQPPAASSLTFPHTGPALGIITPTDPDSPFSVPDPGHPSVPDALQSIPSPAGSSHLLENGNQHDIAAPCAAPDITKISSTANTIVSDSIVTHRDAVPSKRRNSCGAPFTGQSIPVQPDHVLHPLQSPPTTPITALSYTGLQSTSVSDALVTTTIGDPHHDESHDLDPGPHNPMGVSSHTGQSAPPAHGITESALQPDYRKRDQI